jgi:hypothetical protein
MTKPSQTQLTVLAAAADAEEGTTAAASHPKTVASLIKDGLLISVPRADGPSRLMITTKGRAALTPQASDTGEPSAPETNSPAKSDAPAPAPKGKISSLVALLRQPGGTTLEVMMAATGWQAHSVRGAMSGAIKKGMGLMVISEKTKAGRRYRIEAAVAA